MKARRWRSPSARVRWPGSTSLARVAGDAPILYLHGVPAAGWHWEPFLRARAGSRRTCPASAAPTSRRLRLHDRRLRPLHRVLLRRAGTGAADPGVHDWGSVGLAFAQRLPARVERLVLTSCVPFVPGFGWHRVARGWRTPLVGELLMGFTNRPRSSALPEGDRRPRLRRVRPGHPAGGAPPLPGVPARGARAGRRAARRAAPADADRVADRRSVIDTEFGQRLADALGGRPS